MNNRFLPKKGDYCGTEIQIMARTILQYDTLFHQNEDLVFEKAATSLEGKRTKEQVRLWFYNARRIFDEQNRWTKIIDKTLNSIEKERLQQLFHRNYISQPAANGVNAMSLEASPGFVDKSKDQAIKEAILKLYEALNETTKAEIRLALMQL